jgi:hypothetical protein
MARTKQTARKILGGKAPRKQLAAKALYRANSIIVGGTPEQRKAAAQKREEERAEQEAEWEREQEERAREDADRQRKQEEQKKLRAAERVNTLLGMVDQLKLPEELGNVSVFIEQCKGDNV